MPQASYIILYNIKHAYVPPYTITSAQGTFRLIYGHNDELVGKYIYIGIQKQVRPQREDRQLSMQ